MSTNQNLVVRTGVRNSKLGNLWGDIKRIFHILGAAEISIIMTLLSVVFLFGVDQVKDAIIALGNFASIKQFIIFSIIGLLWAFLVWYWARVFMYIQFHKAQDLKPYETFIIEHIPRILGAASLLIIAVAFLTQAHFCEIPGKANPILIIGYIFVFLTVVFIFIVDFCKKIFQLGAIGDPQTPEKEVNEIVPIKDLPGITRMLLYLSTIVAVILLTLLLISPIHLTIFLGDGVTILIGCLCIWLPLFYWVRYCSLKLQFPVFLILFILIGVFSLFNGNKNVRIADHTSNTRMGLANFYKEWDKKVSPGPDNRKPMVIVLSEGGGIRAAYYSAKLLARIQTKYPRFRDYLFGISGVSGGSFGATVFDGLLKCNISDQPGKSNSDQPSESELEKKTTEIVGKDYLSPTIACLFTREFVQLFIPFPISSFDQAKVFEDTWEYYWKDRLNNDPTFSDPFLSLWKGGSGKSIPPLFINSTEVEDGYPILISNLEINSKDDLADSPDLDNTGKDFVIPKDFYNNIIPDKDNSRDVRTSTASLLSARFTYVSPAGTIVTKNGNTIGLVDGGYFENTGANTAYRVLLSLKSWDEKQRQISNPKLLSLSAAALEQSSIFRSKIKPVIIYLQNGTAKANEKTSGRTMFYQLMAPIATMLQVRDAHTNNALFRLEEFVKLYDGDFIPYSLNKDKKTPEDIPLGWALSKKAQEQIDTRVKEIDINKLEAYLK